MCSYKGLCYGKEEWCFLRSVFGKAVEVISAEWLWLGPWYCDHHLGAAAYAALPICKSSRRLGIWNSSMHYNPCTPLMGSTAIPSLAEFSEVLQRSLCRSSKLNQSNGNTSIRLLYLVKFISDYLTLWDLFASLSIQSKFRWYQERVIPSRAKWFTVSLHSVCLYSFPKWLRQYW